jgi:hypothetical protein
MFFCTFSTSWDQDITLFISAVSRAWRESYERVTNMQMAGYTYYYDYDGQAKLFTITSKTTRYSAVFASASTVNLAHECGLVFDNENLQRAAGQAASAPTLRAANELGLQFTDKVAIGAAEAASLSKLQWLHTEQHCQLPDSICAYAARSGSTDILKWLKTLAAHLELIPVSGKVRQLVFNSCVTKAVHGTKILVQLLLGVATSRLCSGCMRKGVSGILHLSVSMQQRVVA